MSKESILSPGDPDDKMKAGALSLHPAGACSPEKVLSLYTTAPTTATLPTSSSIEAGSGAPAVVKLSTARQIGIAVIITSTMCIGGANAMGLTIALPQIQLELDMKDTDLQWIVSAYGLTNGCFLLLAGRLADIFGRKWMFTMGLFWVALWSLIGGWMNNGIGLIITRALAGVGNSMSTPSAIGLIAANFSGRARSYAFSAFAAGAPTGAVLGLMLGGVLTTYSIHTWRAVLWTLGSITFAITAGAFLFIPSPPPKPDHSSAQSHPSYRSLLKRVDWIGAGLVTCGLIFIMFVISDGSTAPQGWATSYIIVLLIAGVIMLAAFVFWEHRIEKRNVDPPLVRLDLFTQAKGRLAAVYFIGFVTWMGFSALMYHATLFYQQVQNTGPIGAMLRFLPTAVSGILCNVLVAYIVGKFRTQWIICFGITSSAIANVLFALASKDGSYWAYPFNGMWMSVMGADFLMSTGSIFVAALARPEEQSVAGAVSQTLIRLGASFGLAITTVLANSYTTRSLAAGVDPVDAQLNGLHAAFWLGAGFSFAALFIAVVMLRGMGVIGKQKKVEKEASETGNKASDK